MKTKIMTLTKFHFTAEIKINKIYLENNLQKPYFFSLKLRFSRVVFKTSYSIMAAYTIFLKITLFSYFWQLFSNKSLMAGAGG